MMSRAVSTSQKKVKQGKGIKSDEACHFKENHQEGFSEKVIFDEYLNEVRNLVIPVYR